MEIIKTENQILIKFQNGKDEANINDIISYLNFIENINKSQITDDQLNEISIEAKKNGWEKNKHRFNF